MGMKKKTTIKIGLDLDGIVAKHSLGGFWVKVRLLKEKLLKKLHPESYYYPRTFLEKEAWKMINWLRIPDKEGINLLKKLKRKNLKFYLITGRFNFNYPSTIRWLKKYQLWPLFEKVLVNVDDRDPTEFKVDLVKKESINYFVDDDLEVLVALQKTPAKLFWVVPGHREGAENHGKRIVTCQSFVEALERMAKIIDRNIA